MKITDHAIEQFKAAITNLEPNAEDMLSNVTIDFRENGFRLDGLKGGGCCG